MMPTAPAPIAATILVLAASLAACSGAKQEKAAQADAKAAAFVPPSVTSRADYGAQQQRRFDRLDHDGDGILRTTELPRDNPRVMALDRNGNREITATEWSEGQMVRFDRMDLNRDGNLTSDERVEAGKATPAG